MFTVADLLLSYVGMAICFLAGYWRGRRVQLERDLGRLDHCVGLEEAAYRTAKRHDAGYNDGLDA